MHITLETLGLAVLLLIALESMLPALMPGKWRQMLAALSQAPTERIQKIALVLLLASLAALLALSA